MDKKEKNLDPHRVGKHAVSKQRVSDGKSASAYEDRVHEDSVRLQLFLARSGVASRRSCETIILDGRVCVNGRVVKELGTKVSPRRDRVMLDGKPVRDEEKIMFLFHKPRGMITSLSDPENRPCVGDMVKNFQYRLFPIGRLDFDVSGLLLLTNDGEHAEKLLHPRYGAKRIYWAIVEHLLR